MAVPTNDEILDAIATDVADGVASATVDGNTATAMDPAKRLDALDDIAARRRQAAVNAKGGRVSGWRGLNPARGTPPGAV